MERKKRLKKKGWKKEYKLKKLKKKVWRIYRQVRRNRDRWKDGKNVVE